MSRAKPFGGFPVVARATAIPNLFFATVLPEMTAPGELLAFLWVARLVQEQRGAERFVSADQVWAEDGAPESFAGLAGGRAGLDTGLAGCLELGALLGLRLTGPAGAEIVYFVNNPGSRRAVTRARAGELHLRPETVAQLVVPHSRPGIFRLYEENIGTITPLVGERLLDAAEKYPAEWVEEAFRRAAERNARNWRYVERILIRWAEEGRGHEGTEGDSFEDRKRRYLGGTLNSLSRHS